MPLRNGVLDAVPARQAGSLLDVTRKCLRSTTSSQRSTARWFEVGAFALPALYAFGSAPPPNSVIGPGFATLDLSIAKQWSAGGTRHLELRWEIFNALNSASFDLPNRFGTENFGRIFSARTPRGMQFGVKLTF